MNKQAICVATLVLGLTSTGASATENELDPVTDATEATPKTTKVEVIGDVSSLKQDLAVPDSPGFIALGLNPEAVARPATVHEFATAVLTGLDKNGNFQAGLALDFAPYLMIKGDDLTITDYRKKNALGYFRRVAASSQVSIATTKGTTSDDESLRLGLGFRANFWNRGDPRLDDVTHKCLKDSGSIPKYPEYKPGETPKEAYERYTKEVNNKAVVVEEAVGACIKNSEARLWNASAFDVGVAPTFIQAGGSSANISWGGATFWGSIAYGFEELAKRKKKKDEDKKSWAAEKSQLILHGRFRLREQGPMGGGVFATQNSGFVGTRWRAGTQYVAFSLEASYLYENPEGASSTNNFLGAVNADIKVVDQTWLLLGVGVKAGRDNATFQLGAGLKWGGRKIDLAALAQSVAQGQGLAEKAAALAAAGSLIEPEPVVEP